MFGRFMVFALVAALILSGVGAAISEDGDDEFAALEQIELRKDDAPGEVELVDDEGDGDPTGDRDNTKGDDGTNGGETGDGDGTAGFDGTSHGDNTPDGDDTRGNDGTGNDASAGFGGDGTLGGGGATMRATQPRRRRRLLPLRLPPPSTTTTPTTPAGTTAARTTAATRTEPVDKGRTAQPRAGTRDGPAGTDPRGRLIHTVRVRRRARPPGVWPTTCPLVGLEMEAERPAVAAMAS